jgi:hypothetical protein
VVPGWTWFNGKLALLYPSQPFVSANVRAFIDLATGRAPACATHLDEDRKRGEKPARVVHPLPEHIRSAA